MRTHATICGGLAAIFMMVALEARAQDFSFGETFEARTVGLLHDQNSWDARKQNDAQVQNATAFSGSQAGLMSTNATLSQSFTNSSATNVWLDFYTQVATYPGDSSDPVLDGSVAGAFFIGADAKVHAISNATWVVIDYTVPLNTWRRFTVNLDYGASNWALYVASDVPNALSTPLATNLAFSASCTNSYFHRFRVKN